jgi:AAA ATPase domain/Trypsin-like peptidase domain/Effector-associated domain 1
MIVLTPTRRAELVDALLESFKAEDLDRRVMDPLRVPPAVRSSSRSVEDRVNALVEWAVKEQRVADLVRVAREANRSSEKLQLLSEALGLVPATSTLANNLPNLGDPREWRRRLLEIQRQVCVVDLGHARATGFLVGPDQVMTHRSLFSWEHGGPRAEPHIRILFDDTPADEPYHFSSMVFSDSNSPVVVLSLDREAGREITQYQMRTAGSAARARGWIVGAPLPEYAADKTIFVIQSNDEGVFTVSVEPDGFVGIDGGTIKYRASTHPGSMGAPCFDSQWRLLGMHAAQAASGDWNEGVSIDAILQHLATSGFSWTRSEGIKYTAAPQAQSAAPPPSGKMSLDFVLKSIDVSATDDSDDEGWGPGADVTEDTWAWAEAAAVVASFVPEQLKPVRQAAAKSRVTVLLESQRIGERWVLSDSLRSRALARLAARQELQKARALNPGNPDDPRDVLLGAYIAGAPPNPAVIRDLEQLRAMHQVVVWLQGVITPLPRVEEIDAALQRATLLAPFRHLTQGFFGGRENETARLTKHVQNDATGGTAKPLFIHGPGGMGKSALLSHFILAHSERDAANPAAWRPFVYLDFDRPDLDARDLSRILLSIARQLGPQLPAIADEARALADRQRTRRQRTQQRPVQRVSKQGIVAGLTRATDNRELREDVLKLIARAATVLPEPILLVFDALEEVQYADASAIEPVAELAMDLRAASPLLRPVLAGRIPPESDALKDRLDLLELKPLRNSVRETILANQLPPAVAARTDIVRRMAEVVGGNPLSLNLAAAACRREKNIDQLVTTLEAELWQHVGDAIVQGRLYERILGHITDADVQALARPGLILRKITPDVIKDVLAGPCALNIPDRAAAEALFQKLSAEVALVRQGDGVDVLELRPELRRVVLEDFQQDTRSQDTQRLIHEGAVKFYADRFNQSSQPEDRAEEIYHRLALDQDPKEIDRLWISGIDHLLLTAIEDFRSERARTYLGSRVGVVAAAEVMRTASPDDWEEWAERRARDLLRFQSASRALEVLGQRPDRLPTSRLHLIESVARRSLSPPDLDGALTAVHLAVEAARRSHDTSYLNEALQELVLVNRLRDDTAGVLAALAELGDLGKDLGDDLVVLQAAVEGLESVAPAQSASEPQFSDTAIRVFARLPDELVARGPELARRVAAQVGADDPATLQRVLRLVGTGSMTRDAANSLQEILKDWADRAPDVAPFVPAVKAGVRDIAGATQYLVTNRSLDKSTAVALTGWLKSSLSAMGKEL